MRTAIKLIMIFILLSGCTKIPSSEEIEKDIAEIKKAIRIAQKEAESYGGLLEVLAKIRIETLKTTQAMLNQKSTGLKRYIPIKYTIDGKNYKAPENKNELINEINKDIKELRDELNSGKTESAKYGGGLLLSLSLARESAIKNSLTFLNQRKLLLKHDIPFYSIVPILNNGRGNEFQKAPGKDSDKF